MRTLAQGVTASEAYPLLFRPSQLGILTLPSRLASNPHLQIIPHATITRIDASGVLLEVVGNGPPMVSATALVMAQGREPACDLMPLLRKTGIVCAAVGDAHAIGRIGDAVHAAHQAVRRPVAEN